MLLSLPPPGAMHGRLKCAAAAYYVPNQHKVTVRPRAQFARQFLEKGNYVLAGARDVRSPLLRDLEKKHPDRIFISEVDVESQNSIIVRSSPFSYLLLLLL